MSESQNDTPTPTGPISPGPWRILMISAAVLLGLAGIAIALLAHYWPFSRDKVSSALGDTFHGTVTFERFYITYFPFPGCIAEGVVLHLESHVPGLAPLAKAERFTLEARYTDLIFRPGYVARIRLDGLHIQVPPRGSLSQSESASDQSNSRTRVGEVTADGALLDVARSGGRSVLHFDIHSVTLNSLSRTDQLSYRVALHNPLPPGEIHSTGRFGPWNSANPAQTPLSGTYTFDHADLRVFKGIAGTLSSGDDFNGILDHIETRGTVTVPNFEVTHAGHPVPLRSEFRAVVNATNGDVFLEKVDTVILHTAIFASGRVAGTPGHRGKTTSLDCSVNQGRIQDFLRLFVRAPNSPLSGETNFKAHVTVPPEGRPFLQEVRLDGEFGIAGGRFKAAGTQAQIDTLSERARGMKPDPQHDENQDQDNVISNLRGRVSLRNGVATLSDFYFEVPGAKAKLNGTYNLLNERVDLHGKLGTEAKFSQTTGGFKSVLLKPLDAIFKGKHHAAVVPVKLTGTYSHPQAGLDLGAKGN
jgi:AsmA-like C-terminal region